MEKFNYTNIHIFDKNGRELPLVIKSSYKIEIPSKKGAPAVFYPIINPDGSLSFYKESSGTRFDNSTDTINCTINGISATAKVKYSSYSAISQDNTDTPITEYSISDIISIDAPEIISNLKFPCAELSSYINFEPVSTELVETESLYVLVKNDKDEYVTIHDLDDSFGTRYELIFYIDNTNQKDFRFFNIENNDVIWTPDKCILNLNSSEEDGYRVNIGFCSEEEGIFNEALHICLLDRGENKSISLNDCEIIPIGTISLNAESIGEDERYRTLFTNFGIPDPKTYNDIFVNTSVEEDKIDNILLNQNSKKLFLTYSEIFPYVGTYKALINAINVLGYDDLYFKEWYRRTGKLKNTGYVSYDITYNSDVNANIINNASLEERIHLKKLNWLSMIYKLNEEIKTSADDQYGFPEVINKYNYHNVDLIAKLISLRDWLQKYVIGLNCKIIDVGGEGIYFERYKLGYYSTYQTLYDYNNDANIAPFIIDTTNKNILVDSSTDILVNAGVDDSRITFEDLSNKKFIDFCEGYFDNNSVYHIGQQFNSEDDILIGKTLFAFSDLERYKIRADVSATDYLLSYDRNINNDAVLDSSSASLIIRDNKLILNPLDIHNGQGCYANFKNLPVIAVKTAQIYEDVKEAEVVDSSIIDWAEDFHETYDFNDYVLLYPVIGSSLRYCEDDTHGIPVFKLKNYDIANYIDSSLNNSTEYIINLIDCKFIFNIENEYDKTVVINFNTIGNNSIVVNTTYYSDEFFVKEYLGGIHHFADTETYSEFIDAYNSSPDDCINYNFESSIKVNTAGEYKVDVIGFDLHNNMFAARCKNNIIIKTPNYDTITLTNYISDTVADSSVESFIKDNYINYCIYEKEYNLPFEKEEFSDKTAITYNDTLSLADINKNDYIHFSNKLEKFNILSANKLGSNTSAKIYKDDKAIDIYGGYELNVERAYKGAIYKFNSTDEDSAKHFTEMFKDTENDVNVVFYNELGGYPVYQTYATLCTDSSNGQFKLLIPDDSAEEYVWASANTIGPKLTAQELTNNTITLLNNYTGSEWQTLENYNKIIYDCYLHYIEKIFNNCDISLNDIAVNNEALANKGMGAEIEDYTQEKMFDFLKLDDTDVYSPINYYEESNGIKKYCFLHNFILDNIFDGLDIAVKNTGGFTDATIEKRKTFKTSYLTYNENSVKTYLNEEINNDYSEDSYNYEEIEERGLEVANSNSLFKDFKVEPELFNLLKNAIANYTINVVKNDGDDNILLSDYVVNEFASVISINKSDILPDVDSSLKSSNGFDNLLSYITDTLKEDNYAYTYKLCVIATYVYFGYYIINAQHYEDDIIKKFLIQFDSEETPGSSLDILRNASIIAIRNYFEYRMNFADFAGATDIIGIDSLETLLKNLCGNGAKGMLIPYKYNTGKEFSSYNEYGIRMLKYIFSENFDDVSKETGWITADRINDDSSNDLFYYGVTYKRDNKLYYLKTSRMGVGGYEYVTTDFPNNYTFDLSVLANKPEIGIYIEPIPKIRVVLNRIDPRLSIDQEVYLPDNQLAVYITSGDYLNLNIGDNIKLMFNSTIIEDRFGQSSYKIVDLDKDDHFWMIIEGNINNEYIRDLGNYITYLPSGNAKWRGAEDKLWSEVCKDMDDCEKAGSTDIYKVSKMTVRLTNDDTGKIRLLSCPTVSGYYNNKEDFKAVKFDNEWRVLISARKSQELYNPRLYEEGNTTLDIYVSYAHTAYTDYVLSADSSVYEIEKGINAIDIKNVNSTLKYLDFIDSKFVMTSREFDTNEGISAWMDITNSIDAIENPLSGIPRILSNSVYVHEYDLPALSTDEPNLVYCIKLNDIIGLPTGYYTYWKIYKRSNTDSGKKYLFESYNPMLYLDCNDAGIYDIELYVYDKFGNTSCTKIDGAFKVF